MTVIFSTRAYTAMLTETAEKIKTETGGLFLGCFEGDTCYIIEAIDPGPKSTFEVAYFEYDQAYTQHLINKIARLYDYNLKLVGLWHRHPGSFDQFSSTDDGTNAQYAQMHSEGAISALVNIDPTFRITPYHVKPLCEYHKVKYFVGDNLIPEKFRQLKSAQSILDVISPKSNITTEDSDELQFSPALENVMSNFFETVDNIVPIADVHSLFDNDPNHIDELLNLTLDDILFLSESMHIKFNICQERGRLVLLQETLNSTAEVAFYFCGNTPFICYKEKCCIYQKGMICKALFNDNAYVSNTSRKGILNRILKLLKSED